jgi:glutaredoxin-related protein
MTQKKGKKLFFSHRSFYIRKSTKQFDDLLTSISVSVEKNTCVVITIENGPYTRQILEILKENGIEVQLIEIGTPFTKIKEREMVKIWSGWDSFPQIYLNGFLLGGYEELKLSLEGLESFSDFL